MEFGFLALLGELIKFEWINLVWNLFVTIVKSEVITCEQQVA